MCIPSRFLHFKGKDSSSIDFMCLTMIDPTTSWFKIDELPTVSVTVPIGGKGKKATGLHYTKDAEIFDKTSTQISNLVYECWFSRYPHCQYMIYSNGSKFKLHFHALCKTYGIKRKPTSIKNPQANAILEHIHAVFTNMPCTANLDMAKLINASDINISRCHMGHSLYPPYSTKSLTRCSNIWTRYAIGLSIHS